MHNRRWFGQVAFCTNLIHILHITRPLFFFRRFGSNKPFYPMGFKVLIRFKVTTWYYGVIPENNLIKRLNKLLSNQLKKKWLKCNFYSNIEFESLNNTVIRFICRRIFTEQNKFHTVSDRQELSSGSLATSVPRSLWSTGIHPDIATSIPRSLWSTGIHPDIGPPVLRSLWSTGIHPDIGPSIPRSLWSTGIHPDIGPSVLRSLWSTGIHPDIGPSIPRSLWSTGIHPDIGPSVLRSLWSTGIHPDIGPSIPRSLWLTGIHPDIRPSILRSLWTIGIHPDIDLKKLLKSRELLSVAILNFNPKDFLKVNEQAANVLSQ